MKFQKIEIWIQQDQFFQKSYHFFQLRIAGVDGLQKVSKSFPVNLKVALR